MTNIDKDDMTRVFRFKKVGFGDAISKSCSCCIVDEAKNVEVGDRDSIDDSSTLYISKPTRNGDKKMVLSSLGVMSRNLPRRLTEWPSK